jgi:hypothetical protein
MTAIIAGILDVADTRGQILGRKGSLQVKGDVAQLLYAVPFARKHVPAHAADFYSLMAGVESDNKGFDFFVPDNSKKMADDLFKTNNLVPAKTIVLHPGSAHKKKMWPVENYAELIKLVEESGFSVVITGVSSEKEIANKIIQFASSRSAINICGVTSISESAAIIAKAFCFISGDTFTMHVAASVGTKTIALFAPTSPLETGPYSENAVALVTDCLCYGNYEGECRMQRSCISKIKPEFVLKFVTGDHVACDKDMAKFYAGLDLQKGFVDYLQNNVSEYSSVSRALLSLVSGKKVVENNIPDHEYRLLKRFYGELLANIALLSRMRGLKDNGQINELVAQNAQI